MVPMKKRNLIIIIVISLIIGAAAGGFSVRTVSTMGDMVAVRAKDYMLMKQMYQKYSKLDRLERFIQANYYKETDPEALQLGIYRGLFYGLQDVYSYYMTSDEYEAMLVTTSSEFQGIGITFSYNEMNKLVIVSTMDDSPAEKAGLRTGDIIVMVDGVAYSAAEMDEAGAKMRGKPGTKVKLTIERNGETEEYTITRANIVKHSIKTEMLDGNIAYVRISAFEEHTGDEFATELRSLEKKQVKGMIVDLRNNGGGMVSAGVKIADLLLPECTIVSLVNYDGDKTVTNSDKNATQIPYVLLVNGGTASTSEILAAAIKDNNGGKLVGTKTFGKGVVQSIIPLDDGSGDAIKLTTSQYLSPNGKVIHEKGIEPSVTVELKENDDRDYQLEKAIELLK